MIEFGQLFFRTEFETYRIRFVGTYPDIQWILQDICAATGFTNTRAALRSIKELGKGKTKTDSGVDVLTITTEGLQALIKHWYSRKPKLVIFDSWLIAEAMPNICAHKVQSEFGLFTQSIATKQKQITGIRLARSPMSIRYRADVKFGVFLERSQIADIERIIDAYWAVKYPGTERPWQLSAKFWKNLGDALLVAYLE